MSYYWDWFWSIIWNMLVHAVTLQWSDLDGDKDDLVDWWNTLWSVIVDTATGIATNIREAWRDWIQGISDYAYSLYLYAYDIYNKLGAALWASALSVADWVVERVQGAINYAFDLYNAAIAFADEVGDLLETWVVNYVGYWIGWVVGQFNWIQPYYDLIANWLTGVTDVIDWLRNVAWSTLQAFLNDPIGFVLGWWLDSIIEVASWWIENGWNLANFIANELDAWRDLFARGLSFLSMFVDDPLETILTLLAPVVLDWLEERVVERW